MKQSPASVLNQNPPWKNDLPLDELIKVENQANNMLHHQQIMAQHQVQTLSHAHFASLIETGQGIKGFDDLLRSGFAADDQRLVQIREKESLYKQAFLVSEQLKNASFAQGQDILQQLAPQAGDHDYDQKEKLYNILVKQFQQQIKEAKEDPARLAEEMFGEEIPQDLPFVQRLLMRKSFETQKGIPPDAQKYLMKAERRNI